MPFNKEQIKQLLKIAIIAIIIYWLINNISIIGTFLGKILNVLFPFILGICLAFIFNIPMNFFENLLSKSKKRKNKKSNHRIASIILTIIVIFAIIILVFGLIIPQLVNVCKLLLDKVPQYTEKVKDFASNTLESQDIITMIENIDSENLKKQIIQGVITFLTASVSVIGNIASGITNFVIALVFAIYILISKEKIKNQIKRILNAYLKEKQVNKILKISRLSSTTFKKFLIGQCTEACILGSLCAIGMLILNIPYAITIGVLVGVTALVPIVGAFIGVIIGALLIVSVEPVKAIIFIVFFLVLQQIEGNLIYPKVVGNSVGLPGLLVLFAVTVGGSLFGIVGMVIGLPILSIIYTIIQEDVDNKLENKGKIAEAKKLEKIIESK